MSYTPLDAARFWSGEKLLIEKDEVVEEDLYAMGEDIRIEGTVKGDVLALGRQVTISGTVEGDVMAAAQAVLIEGNVGDNARITGQALKLASGANVAGDVLAAGYSLECEPETIVTGDLIFGGLQTLLDGEVQGDADAGCLSLELNGTIGGNANLEVGGTSQDSPPPMYGQQPPISMPTVQPGLTIGETAKIGGDLLYASPEQGSLAPGAEIAGEVEHTVRTSNAGAAAPPPNPIWTALRRFASLLIVGLLLVAILPRRVVRLSDAVQAKPMLSLGWGAVTAALLVAAVFLFLILTIVACILFGVLTLTELIPVVLIVGTLAMASLTGLGWVYATYVAQVVVALVVGRLLLRQFSENGLIGRALALAVGLLLVVALSSVPFAGAVVAVVVSFLGLGALWVASQTNPAFDANPQTGATVPAAKPVPA